MNLKKIGAVISSVSLLASLAAVAPAFAHSAKTASHVSKHVKTKPIVIGFVPGVTTDPFFISMEYGAQMEAKRLGVQLIYEGGVTYSPSNQTPYVNAMVARKVSALAIAPTDLQAMIPPIRNAVKSKIPVITVDSTISDTALLASRITSNNLQGGAAAANFIGGFAKGKGVVAILSPSPGISTDKARVAGFTAELKKKYPHMQVVVEYDNEQSTQAVQLAQDLSLRFGNRLVGIFGTDDTSASGAAEGIRASGKLGKVKIVGYDAEPAEVQDLKQGLISALIAQKPMEEGMLAVQYAVAAAKGQKVTKFVQLANVTITKANLAKNAQWEYRSTI
ncbi:ABC transporter substrate-binding protein [Ferroacidibacillus organovorans]|uniref:Periplasmic binding protein domain-containing protein n=1 Tax=Ferroacidibacillus organovorans TaxID=1765683 RepID=A0A117SXV5_9BACL|nr:ABC transporter substrate-binding protein [Ferroacidibacillus organovorans]KUO96080.1 hypothetical protein ATW55_01555 [Ferroacidibacillus organovorans]